MIKNFSIDLGSNTLKVAYIDDGKLKNLEEVLNLGLYYENENISEKGIEILLKTFSKLALKFDLKNAKVVATAIFRKSKNANEIIKILENKFGFRLRILSQDDEARFTRLGVGINGDFTLVDVGGYSTEISSNNKKLLLDIGLLSFYKFYKLQNKDIRAYAEDVFKPYLKQIQEFKKPIVLASKTGIFAKSLIDNIGYFDLDDLSYHNAILYKYELMNLINFLENNNLEKREWLVGKNRDFAVLCGAYFLDVMFDCDEFIISAYGLKEGILFYT